VRRIQKESKEVEGRRSAVESIRSERSSGDGNDIAINDSCVYEPQHLIALGNTNELLQSSSLLQIQILTFAIPSLGRIYAQIRQ
jgi:hypothetical protein